MNQVRPVERAMRTTLLLVALAALAVGCSKPEVKTTSNSNTPRALTDQEKLNKIRETAQSVTDSIPDSVYAISEPGTNGWKPTKGNFEQVGAAMDKRLSEVENVKVLAVLTFDDPKVGKMLMKPRVLMADAKTFDIEYALPDLRESQIWVRGDGQRRARSVDAVWSELPGSDARGRAISEKEVREFPRRFPELMFGKLTDGIEVWGPLFAAWKKGVAGYKVRFEEQKFKIEGKDRIHYRIVAQKKVGGEAEVEVTIDSEAFRPVAVRSVGTLENGQKYKILWTGDWMVGGTLNKSDFSLPKELPKAGEGA